MLALSLAWVATLSLGYILSERTLNKQLDAQMVNVAKSIKQNSETEFETSLSESFSISDGKHIEYQVWQNNKLIRSSTHAPTEGLAQTEGYSQSSHENRNWRVYSTHESQDQIMVGEDLDVRQALVHDMVLSGLWPMLIAWPLIGLILWISVKIGLRPLAKLNDEIERRSAVELAPIEMGDVPAEVAPMIQSLNRLFVLVSGTVQREQQFADNAAHELRSPLTAIKAFTQVALRSKSEAEKDENLRAVT